MVVTRLLRWLMFTVLVALLPFAYAWLRTYQHGRPGDLADVAGAGDLYLLSVALCAGGVGELIGNHTARRHVGHVIVGGLAVAWVAMASSLFADVAAARIDANGVGTPPGVDPAAVSRMSAWVFVSAVAVSGTCVGLGERCSTTSR